MESYGRVGISKKVDKTDESPHFRSNAGAETRWFLIKLLFNIALFMIIRRSNIGRNSAIYKGQQQYIT